MAMPTLICATTRRDAERIALRRGLSPAEWQRLSNEHQVRGGQTFRVILDHTAERLPEYGRIQFALNLLQRAGTLVYV